MEEKISCSYNSNFAHHLLGFDAKFGRFLVTANRWFATFRNWSITANMYWTRTDYNLVKLLTLNWALNTLLRYYKGVFCSLTSLDTTVPLIMNDGVNHLGYSPISRTQYHSHDHTTPLKFMTGESRGETKFVYSIDWNRFLCYGKMVRATSGKPVTSLFTLTMKSVLNDVTAVITSNEQVMPLNMSIATQVSGG